MLAPAAALDFAGSEEALEEFRKVRRVPGWQWGSVEEKETRRNFSAKG